jgi:hypothetical protein
MVGGFLAKKKEILGFLAETGFLIRNIPLCVLTYLNNCILSFVLTIYCTI